MASQDYTIELLLKANNQLSGELTKIQGQIDKLENQVNNTNNSVNSAFSKITSFVSKGLIIGAITKVTKGIITLGDNLEKAKISFTTMLGSAEKAEDLLSQLSDFAKKTPFELTGIRESATQLLAMGVQAEDMIPTLKALGDTSAGLQVPLQRLALNYGQVMVQGKLTAKELKDFTVAGVPLIDELSEMLGKSKSEIQDMASSGEISADTLTEVFQKMTSEGGRFADLMNQQADTLSGKWSNLQDSLSQIGEAIGTEIIPHIKDYVGRIGDFVEENKETIKNVGIEAFDVVKTAIDNVIGAIKEILPTIQSFYQQVSEGFTSAMSWISGSNEEATTGIMGNRSDLFYFMKLGFTVITQTVKTVVVAITSYFHALLNSIGDIVGNIGDIFSALWSDVKNGALNMAENCVNYVVKLVNGVIDKINRLVTQMNKIPGVDIDKLNNVSEVDFGGGETGKLKEKLANLGTMIADNFKEASEKTSQAFQSGMDTLTDVYAKRVEQVTKNATKSLSGVANKVKDIIEDDDDGGGGGKGNSKTSDAIKKIKEQYELLTYNVDEQYKKIQELNKERKEGYDELADKFKEADKNVKDLSKSVGDLKQKLADLNKDETSDIATEFVNARKELQKMERDYAGIGEVAKQYSMEYLENFTHGGIGKYDIDALIQYKKYSDEMASVYDGLNDSERKAMDEQIAYQERYQSLNGIEKIKEDYRIKREEIQGELNEKMSALRQEELKRAEIDKQMKQYSKERLQAIDNEIKKYAYMVGEKKRYEKEYMDQLEIDYKRQQQMYDDLIRKAKELARVREETGGPDGRSTRANGGPVYSGQQYLVGEHGPELFIPSQNGSIVKNEDLGRGQEFTINVNMGGVVVNDGQDTQQMAEEIANTITRQLELYKKGIY